MDNSEQYKKALEELAYRREKQAKNYRGTGGNVYNTVDKVTPKEYITYLLDSCRANAQSRGLEFNITYEDLRPLPERCKYFGWRLLYSISREVGRKYNTASIDRIDNTKGYIQGNVHIISWKANQIKHTKTLEEFEDYVKQSKEKQLKFGRS